MTEENDTGVSSDEILRMAVDIASAYLSCNKVATSEVPEAIKAAYSAIVEIEQTHNLGLETKQKPAVSVRRSITPDYIVCLEDGKQLKMLKRHLRTTYGMTPDEYRLKWGLPSDYPMVAPNYAKQRSEFAKKIGLGKK